MPTDTRPNTGRAAVELKITAYWARHIEAACDGDLDLAETHRKRVDELLEKWQTADNEAAS